MMLALIAFYGHCNVRLKNNACVPFTQRLLLPWEYGSFYGDEESENSCGLRRLEKSRPRPGGSIKDSSETSVFMIVWIPMPGPCAGLRRALQSTGSSVGMKTL